jgi:hypothetical protein
MNKTITHKEESGQILIILTVGIVALLGFLALAIDGGMIYADRRYDQNAADASSFAGGGAAAMSMENQQIYHTTFDCSSTDLQNVMNEAKLVAINRAQSNLFTIDSHIGNQHGVEIYCNVPTNPFAPRFLDVHTMISSELQTAFAHLFYQGPVRNTVDATVRVVVGGDAAFGNALATLSDRCDEGIRFSGGGNHTPSVHIKGSGAHSNSCVTRDGSFKVVAEAGVTHFVSPNGYSGHGNTSQGWIRTSVSATTESVTPLAAKIPRPDFDEITAFCANTNYNYPDYSPPHPAYREINPGTYTNIVVPPNQKLLMKPGLYCIKGDFTFTRSTSELEGQGVTIVLLENASLKINSGKVTLIATSDEKSSYRNLLIYAVTSNTKTHSILGNAESYYQGTILLPYANFELGGESGTTGNKMQVIANHVWLHGGGTLLMDFDNTMVWNNPARVSLVK